MSEELVNKLKECLVDKKIDSSNIIELMMIMMKTAEKFDNLNGHQKKELVLRTLGKVVTEMLEEDDDKNLLEKMLQQTLPLMIDALVLADKKGIFEKVKPKCFLFCKNK